MEEGIIGQLFNDQAAAIDPSKIELGEAPEGLFYRKQQRGRNFLPQSE